MKKEERYFAYANEHFVRLQGKGVILTGATGGIGKAAARLLASLRCRLLFLVRNVKAGEELAAQLEETYGVEIKVFPYDSLDREAVSKVLSFLADEKPYDYFLSIAGIYHQPAKMIDGIEQTFRVNCLASLELILRLSAAYPETESVQTLSLTYRTKPHYQGSDLSDALSFRKYLASIHSRNERYGLSKRFLMQALVAARHEGVKVALAHPGVVCTNLFNPKNKAYPRWFYRVAPPLMRVIFMPAEEAALSLLKAAADGSKEGKIVGPGGFLHAWGYPKEYQYRRDILRDADRIASLLKELMAL